MPGAETTGCKTPSGHARVEVAASIVVIIIIIIIKASIVEDTQDDVYFLYGYENVWIDCAYAGTLEINAICEFAMQSSREYAQ
eukprot:SAG31_NODE_367_length_16811_cov_20.811584_4_plen_83_part_00